MAKKIIAVFGPSGPNTFSVTASSLGEHIAASNMLLTGGTGIPDKSVKEQAIVGAERAISAGATGRWIGVPKAGSRTLSPFPRHGFVVKTEYRNERNYINAFLCDGAIALRGGPGTDSEVAFCLALGRPVVLLGPEWTELSRQLTQPPGARKAVVAMIDRMFPPGNLGQRPVDRAIRASAAVSAALSYVRLDSVAELDRVSDAVAIAIGSADNVDRSELGNLLGDDCAGQFLSWLGAG